VGAVALLATTLVACSSTNSSSGTGSGGSSKGGSKIPSSAFSNHTGISSNSVDVGNVSTLAVGGLFKGALVGTEAYADYVNSTGGINGRKIHVNGADDGFTGAGNRQATQNAMNNDFSLVGSFSLQDNYGGQLLEQDPGMPDVSVALNASVDKLPNVFAAVPADGGWQTGPLLYFKQKFPNDVDGVGTIVSNQPSALVDWAGEKYVLEKEGYKVVYVDSIPETQTDFTQNVIAMRNAGVKIVFIDQLPEIYASSLLKDFVEQNFHPQIILGAASYSKLLVFNAGGPGAVQGAYWDQNASLYLGGDAFAIPAVAQFLKWVQVASPGFQPDLFTLYGWLSGQLFSQALKNAGSDPSRGSLLQALSKITTFSGNNIVTTTNPAGKTLSNCYLVGDIVNGTYQRLDDPPINSSTNGYRCNGQYLVPPGS
jgi:ABC-type branched-subunit amino acid transport system substrate-binding protein